MGPQQELKATPLGKCKVSLARRVILKLCLEKHSALFGTRRRRIRRFLAGSLSKRQTRRDKRRKKKTLSKPCGKASAKQLSSPRSRSRKWYRCEPRWNLYPNVQFILEALFESLEKGKVVESPVASILSKIHQAKSVRILRDNEI